MSMVKGTVPYRAQRMLGAASTPSSRIAVCSGMAGAMRNTDSVRPTVAGPVLGIAGSLRPHRVGRAAVMCGQARRDGVDLSGSSDRRADRGASTPDGRYRALQPACDERICTVRPSVHLSHPTIRSWLASNNRHPAPWPGSTAATPPRATSPQPRRGRPRQRRAARRFR